jgi:hypothetical protein
MPILNSYPKVFEEPSLPPPPPVPNYSTVTQLTHNPMFSPYARFNKKPNKKNTQWLEEAERQQAQENAAKGLPGAYTGTPSTAANAQAFYNASNVRAKQVLDEAPEQITGKGGAKRRRYTSKKSKRGKSRKDKSKRN